MKVLSRSFLGTTMDGSFTTNPKEAIEGEVVITFADGNVEVSHVVTPMTVEQLAKMVDINGRRHDQKGRFAGSSWTATVPGEHAGAGAGTSKPLDLQALKPDSRWSSDRSAATRAELSKTEDGAVLVDTLAKFQSTGSIGVVRGNMKAHHLGTRELDPTSKKRAEVLTQAMRQEDPVPGLPLYRGVTMRGTPKQILAKYAPGERVDLNVTSFSTSPGVADAFAGTKGPGRPVTIELVPNEHRRGLAIQNMAPDASLFSEHEVLTAGVFTVRSSGITEDGGILIQLQQWQPL